MGAVPASGGTGPGTGGGQAAFPQGDASVRTVPQEQIPDRGRRVYRLEGWARHGVWPRRAIAGPNSEPLAGSELGGEQHQLPASFFMISGMIL